jgi:hypothetical protein
LRSQIDGDERHESRYHPQGEYEACLNSVPADEPNQRSHVDVLSSPFLTTPIAGTQKAVLGPTGGCASVAIHHHDGAASILGRRVMARLGGIPMIETGWDRVSVPER